MRVTRKDAAAWVRQANQVNREARKTMKPRREGPRIRQEHPRAGSRYELELQRLIAYEGLPSPAMQLWFAKDLGRRYRFDFAWPDRKIAAEVDGGRWLVRRGKDGRPVPVGFHNHIDDYRKLNLAAKLGWKILRFTPEMIHSGEAIQELRSVLVVPS